MSEFRRRDTGQIVTEAELRVVMGNVSLPAVIDSDACDVAGVDPVLESPQPELEPHEIAVIVGAEQDKLGNWVKKWDVRRQSRRELAVVKDAELTALRQERNRLLVASDWTQLLDSPVDKEAWAEYRQALRDLPAQDDKTWPEEPINSSKG